MLYTIENEFVKATISSTGTELQSLVLKADNSEYLWQANPALWDSHAPILFPIIARLKDGEYVYDGKTYKMSIHGFARDVEWEVVSQEAESITFVLKSNEESLKLYPFAFEVQVCYTLEGHTLKKDHTVINRDDKVMYYELGGHDGYNLCLEEGEVMEDYYIDFGNVDVLHPLCCNEKIEMLDETYDVPLTDGKLKLSMDVFKRDALVLHNVPVKTVTVKSVKSSRQITFEYEDFNTLGIWTRYVDFDTNYVCLEPWSSLPDCAYLGKELEEKVDIRKLEAGQKETLSFAVTIQ